MSRVEQIECSCAGVTVSFVGDVRECTIYGITDGVLPTVVYVGSTTRVLRDRIRQHVLAAKEGSDLPLHAWMRSHLSGFTVVVLERAAEGQREIRERHWIAHHKCQLNVTDGGPGMSGHKFAGTDHAKRIAAAIRSGAEFECQRCGTKFWRKRNEIARGHKKFCSRVCSNGRHKEMAHVA